MVDLKQNLHFWYWLIIASEDLLKVASAMSDYGRLKSYYLRHLREEKDHATWLRQDLERLEIVPVQDFRAAAIAGSQYYLIYHYHPALLLGYMLTLESWPRPLDVIDRIEAVYGPMRCLRFHAEHDPKHTEDLRAEIAALPEFNDVIETNASWTLTWLSMVFNTMDKETLCTQIQA